MHRNKPRYSFHDEHIETLLENRFLPTGLESIHRLQTNSSMFQKFCKLGSDLHLTCNQFNSLSWSSSGSTLMGSTSHEISTRKWSHSNFGDHREYRLGGRYRDISCVKIVPDSDSTCVFGADKSRIYLFDIRHDDTRAHEIISCHSAEVFNFAFPNENPNVILSTSVDCTVRQHDLRDRCKGGDRCTLFDLDQGKRFSLDEGPRERLTLCSSDLSRSSNLILVGGDDRFGRLFDRRILHDKRDPISYYCPKHLSLDVQKSHKIKHIQVAKVAFSPNELEVLISYKKEHIYVMSLHHGKTDEEKEDMYYPDDVTQMFKVDVNIDEPTMDELEEEDVQMRDLVKELLLGCNIHESIDILDAVLSLPGRPIGPGLIFEWLCCRAEFLIKRNWKNDAHMAIRDCDRARKLKKGDYKPFYYLSEALTKLGRDTEALESAKVAEKLSPSNHDVKKLIKDASRRAEKGDRFKERGVKLTQDYTKDWWNTYRAIDMKQRFVGHGNHGKQQLDAHFFGPTGNYIVSTSDDNRLYIWEKRSGRLIRTLKDEDPIGRILQCHPHDFAVATAGLKNMQMWAPGDTGVETDADDDLQAMVLNQNKLRRS